MVAREVLMFISRCYIRACVCPEYFNYNILKVAGRIFTKPTIGVGAQLTLGGHDIFARKICVKN